MTIRSSGWIRRYTDGTPSHRHLAPTTRVRLIKRSGKTDCGKPGTHSSEMASQVLPADSR